MKWKGSPKIIQAREIAKQFGKKQVIVLMIDDNTLEVASYGATERLCEKARRLASVAYEAVYVSPLLRSEEGV